MSNGTPAPVPPAPTPPRWWLPWVAWAAAMLGWAVAAYLGWKGPPPLPPMDVEVQAQGWIDNPDEVDKVVRDLQFKSFADTPAGKSADPLPTHAYLWQSEKKATGSNPPSKNQNPVGSCVSFGTNTAIERTIAVEVSLGKPFRVVRLVEEATYGGSRVEVGGGRIRGDGSVGAWAADWVRKWGVVERKSYPGHDLTRYDPQRCRDWGKNGVPDDVETLARNHSVQTTTLVANWDDAKRALAQGYGIAICSSQGFSMKRDSNGVCRASGSWAHCVPYGTMISTQIPKPCQDVVVGDMVVGHDGRLHAIKQVHTRPYDDDLIALKIDGMVPTRFTLHHPVLVYRPMRAHGTKFAPGLAMAVYSGGKYSALVDRYAAWEAGNPVWLAAEEVMAGDYVLSPKLKANGDVQMPAWADAAKQSRNVPTWPAAPTEDLAWLMGLYIADGNAVAGHRVVITLNKSETLSVERACRAWASLGLNPRLVEKDTFTRVIVDSAVAAASFRGWFGTSSAEKQIPEFLYHGWDTRAVLDGILDGDGCNTRRGCVISTTSNRLALQIHQLLLTHGERPAMQRQPRNGSEFPNAAPGWTVSWQPAVANARMRHWGDYYLMPVRDVTRERYTGAVWNYEVDEVHTYLTNNIVSHNCMALDGYHAEGGTEYGHIENSWGPDAHTGPVGWGDPPTSGFWAESRTIDKMLKQGDSWAFSAVKGFPARRIDWLVHVDQPHNSYARRGYRPCEPLFSLAP